MKGQLAQSPQSVQSLQSPQSVKSPFRNSPRQLRTRLTEREILFVTVGLMAAVLLGFLRFGVITSLGRLKSLDAERARLSLAVKVAERASGRVSKLASRRDELAREVGAYRVAAFPGLAGDRAAMRLLTRLDNLAGPAGVTMRAKSARYLVDPEGGEELTAELVIGGRASRIFAYLREVAAAIPQSRLDNLALTRAQDGASWEARIYLVLTRPALVAGLQGDNGTDAGLDATAQADGQAGASVSIPNLLSGRVFGERPVTPVRLEAKEAAPKPAPLESAYQLMGFADNRKQPRAVLREKATGQTVIVAVGDVVTGEKVLAIGRTGVEIALADGGREMLPLP